jgi:hypothetical protein
MQMPTSDITELLRELEDDLGQITQRLYLFEAFGAELERVTRTKPFRIWGSGVWMLIIDSRDTHVTHLGSWLKSLYRQSGFFGKLKASHPKAFPRKWRGTTNGRSPFADRPKTKHDETFKRLFPEAAGAYARPADIDGLRATFIAGVEHVVADRDENRAHPYEKDGSASGSVKMLNFKELREVTQFVEVWLNELRLLSTRSWFEHRNMNFQDSGLLARDLVDAVLIGSRERSGRVMAEGDRERYYDLLHARHAELGNPEAPLFNDYSASPRRE